MDVSNPVEIRSATGRWAARRIMRACAVACALAGLAASARAQNRPSEYDVKAAYLFNFGKFLRFAPGSGPHGSFNFCILGRDLIEHPLDQIASGESIAGQPAHVEKIADAAKARDCAVLFIGADDDSTVRAELSALSGAGVLTVSDMPGFLDRGGMIQFVLAGDHVRFEVNLDAVNRAHLSLSSELLRVAAAVRGKPGPGGDQ